MESTSKQTSKVKHSGTTETSTTGTKSTKRKLNEDGKPVDPDNKRIKEEPKNPKNPNKEGNGGVANVPKGDTASSSEIPTSTLPPLNFPQPAPETPKNAGAAQTTDAANTGQTTNKEFILDTANRLINFLAKTDAAQQTVNADRLFAPFRKLEYIIAVANRSRVEFEKNQKECIQTMIEGTGFTRTQFTEKEWRTICNTLSILLTFTIDNILDGQE